MPSVYQFRDKFRVQWSENGKRHWKLFDGKNEAKRFVAQLELGVADKNADRKNVPTFSEFADRWLRDYCREHKAKSQWETDARTIRNHLTPYLGFLKLTDLKRSHLLQVQVELKRKRAVGKKHLLAPKTVNLAIALAKTMLSTAVQWELVPTNPWASVKLLKLPARRPAYWTPSQRDQFIALAMPIDPAFTRAVIVACHTGLRLGELAALTKSDVDFDRAMIRVSKSLDVNKGNVGPTKNGDIADVPMNEAVREALTHARFLAPDAPVFERALFWSARKRLGRLCKQVSVPPIRFHDLRHTFASCLAMAGVDLMRIQKLCRHKSYAMTLRYAHLAPDHLKGATDVLCQTAHNRRTNGGVG